MSGCPHESAQQQLRVEGMQGPVSHFFTQRNPSEEQGKLHLRGFSFEGQGKGKLGKTQEERPVLMRKRGK